MGRPLAPLHVGDFGGRSVRYFASPVYQASRQPDMPWHSVDDLWPLLVPEDTQAVFDLLKRKLRSDWQEPRTVATADGLATIAPHFMGEGIFAAFASLPASAQPDGLRLLRGRYRNGCTQALKAMIAHLDPMQRMLFSLSAFGKAEDETVGPVAPQPVAT